MLVSQMDYFAGKPVNQSINQSIPLFKCQTNIAVEEPLDGETIIKIRNYCSN